jgi:glycosyltransferase involved in cell wall biosynthesis
MKILHIVPSFGFGGMEKIICSIINHTSNQYDHEILALDNETKAARWLNGKSAKLIDFQKSQERVKFFKALYTKLRQVKPDLLMTYNWGATDAIWLGRLAGIARIVHNEHGFNIDEIHSFHWKRDFIRFFVYRLSSKVVVVSQDLNMAMHKKFSLKENNKVVFIPNGIDTDHYSPNVTERKRLRQKLGFKETDFIIGFSGRLDPIKNFNLMIDIFEYCVNRDNRCRLLIVGDGCERKRIENICQKKKISEYCVLVGDQEDVLPYLRVLDVFLLTSLREQMPLTVLEAMSVGIPVVASGVGEIPRMIESNKEGYIRDRRESPEGFALPLLTLRNQEKRTRIGRAARNKVIACFREEVMIQKYRDIIEGLI